MTRILTVTIGLLLSLAFAGCGKDEKTDATTEAATTETTREGAAGSAGEDSDDGGSGGSGSQERGAQTTTSGSRGSTTTAGRTSTTGAGGRLVPGSGPSRSRTTTTGTPAGAGTSAPLPAGRPGNEPPSVSQVVLAALRRFEDAIISGDGARVCDALTARARRDVVGNSSRTCAQVAGGSAPDGETEPSGAGPADVAVDGSVATVELGGGRRVKLLFEGDRWLVDDELA
ncbi:MAG TPA: hypothetical protein VMY78_10420 [Solirubrobacteraceae bacterium]|nr:hypothetical protein [Solirubrobacteraceae bacterium]